MYAETRLGHATGHGGLIDLVGVPLYRTRDREQRVLDYPRRPLQGTLSVPTCVTEGPSDTSPDDLLFLRGYGALGAMNGHSFSSLVAQGNCSTYARSSVPNACGSNLRSPQLCRCGSGGALPATAAANLMPPVHSGSPPALFAPPASSFGTVQSLPSSPNANRRPLSPPTATSAVTNAALSSRPSDHRPFAGSSRPEQFLFESPPVSAQPRREGIGGQISRRLRASKPLAKLSSLVIVVFAIIIIGFIVLSPVLHYVM